MTMMLGKSEIGGGMHGRAEETAKGRTVTER
jgi:hypothetical protein